MTMPTGMQLSLWRMKIDNEYKWIQVQYTQVQLLVAARASIPIPKLLFVKSKLNIITNQVKQLQGWQGNIINQAEYEPQPQKPWWDLHMRMPICKCGLKAEGITSVHVSSKNTSKQQELQGRHNIWPCEYNSILPPTRWSKIVSTPTGCACVAQIFKIWQNVC